MKKMFLASIAIVFSMTLSITVFGANFGYPFGQISEPSCRKEAWSTLNDTCKMPLPKIVNGDYEKYKSDTKYRRIYTVLWGSTYDYGWDVGLGSHLGVDIATSAGTPVLAIADGEVIQSSFSNGWGNFITIKHTLADTTNIYSNYAHLSRRIVNKGDIVKLGQNIGEVGNTGNSYGNHLHFQIDITNQFHPYYYVTCAKGKNSIALVNQGECRNYLTNNTIDPIMFLETGILNAVPPTASVINTIKNKPIVIIEKSTIKSREEILNEEAEEYLKSYTIEPKIPLRGIVIPVDNPYYFNIEVRDFNKKFSTKNITGAGVKITFDSAKVNVFPTNFTQLTGGKRQIKITPKTSGPIDIVFSVGKKVIARKHIFGLTKGKKIITDTTEILTIKKGYVGQEYDMYVSPLAAGGFYVGTNSYAERYRIEVIKGKAKFCLKVPQKGTSCDSSQVVEMIEFSKKDTPLGFYTTRVIPLISGKIELRVTPVGKTIGVNSKISAEIPISLDRRNIYYDAIIAGISKNWWKTRSGYVGQDQELSTDMVKEIITRVLNYQVLKAGNNRIKKQTAINTRELFMRSSKSLESKKWGRAEFAELFLKAMRIPTIKGDPIWHDERGIYQDSLATLRTKYEFQWKDQFGERYFQSTKSITLAEALYLIGEVVK